MSSIEAMNLQRGDRCEVFIDGEWNPALFVATDLIGNEPIVQRIGFMPTFATWKTLRVSDSAIKAAQPPEYPSAADDEATRFRHGEPSAIKAERPGWVSVPRDMVMVPRPLLEKAVGVITADYSAMQVIVQGELARLLAAAPKET